MLAQSTTSSQNLFPSAFQLSESEGFGAVHRQPLQVEGLRSDSGGDALDPFETRTSHREVELSTEGEPFL